MSFSSQNENFLKFQFHIPLRGLTENEKELKYDGQIRSEARRRFHLYYETVKNDIPGKIALYQELLDIFGSLERQLLIYSIYLDLHSEEICFQLGKSAVIHLGLQEDSLRRLLEQKVPRHDGSYIKGYLKEYFSQKLELLPGEWEEENGKHNPVTSKLAAWLVNKISIEHVNKPTLREFILNYTNLWNVYFTKPYDYRKAILLLHKFLDLYNSIAPQSIRINIYHILYEINQLLINLLPCPYNSPLTDVGSAKTGDNNASNSVLTSVRGYLNKSNEFWSILESNTVFFENLSDQLWPELLLKTCATQLPARNAYIKEITKRINDGKSPNFSSLTKFLEKISDANIKQHIDQEILKKIISDNYLFYS